MLLVCPHCGTRNRVPDERRAENPSCGRCGEAVAPRKRVAISDAALPCYLSGTEAPVLVDRIAWANARKRDPRRQASEQENTGVEGRTNRLG